MLRYGGWVRAGALVLLVCIVTLGCGSRQPPARALEQRAKEYWAARAINDLSTVYKMESGSLPGGSLTPQRLADLLGIPVRNARVQNPRVQGSEGTVTVSGDVGVGTLGTVRQQIDDHWTLVDGQWYHKTASRRDLGLIFQEWAKKREKESQGARENNPGTGSAASSASSPPGPPPGGAAGASGAREGPADR
jgi:hypothetical protein